MKAAHGRPATPDAPLPQRQVALIDLLDRLLGSGVVLTGDIVLSIADIDLVRISLRALIVSISEQHPAPWATGVPQPPERP
ncbi:gas vesicle protein [Kitasatospora sp. NPDC085879]|uniref:gas vesicle protein n=1 Tax=Kitasatospora sp. NPDC085879 TaxID=3154769 RepID=UPI000BB1262A|nr:gas vesicle protein [Streptomyces sp. TLI_235]PBC70290.1 gas vesicle protein GvpA/GvpJ/GvpM family [Streptomyces sp. TLI_235]